MIEKVIYALASPWMPVATAYEVQEALIPSLRLLRDELEAGAGLGGGINTENQYIYTSEVCQKYKSRRPYVHKSDVHKSDGTMIYDLM